MAVRVPQWVVQDWRGFLNQQSSGRAYDVTVEPNLETHPSLVGILDELIRREPIFHRPEFGTSRSDFERMTREDFWEIGASGRRYSREYVLDMLEKRHATPHPDIWEAMEFQCRSLAQEVYLLTYTLIQDKVRKTRRSTIWERTAAGWKIVFHQGTIVADDFNQPLSPGKSV